LETKLGAFKFSPGIYKYLQGSNYGGTSVLSSGVTTATSAGSSGSTDYSFALTYDNDDEQMELGVLFVRRVAGMNSSVINPFQIMPTGLATAYTPGGTGYAYNVWDFYLKKKIGIVTAAAEVPLVTGLVNGATYSAVAGAVKIDTQVAEHWKIKLNTGLAPGQANLGAGGTASSYTAFSFHPDYRPGLLMFNYNYRNFSSGGSSLYNNPITNAKFLSLGVDFNSAKWTHDLKCLIAAANDSADGTAGGAYFNSLDGFYKANNSGALAQSKNLGTEFDYSLGYDWDESLRLGLVLGLYFPGQFYAFNNSSTASSLTTVFGSGLNLLVKF